MPAIFSKTSMAASNRIHASKSKAQANSKTSLDSINSIHASNKRARGGGANEDCKRAM
jgi:hypothetical protein